MVRLGYELLYKAYHSEWGATYKLYVLTNVTHSVDHVTQQ